MGCAVPSGKITLFQTLFFVVQTHLACDDDRCLQILSLRLQTPSDEVANGTILEVDEAVQFLDKDDIDEMKDEKVAQEKRLSATHSFL